MDVGGVGAMIHIEDLPEELLLKVFSYLPVPDLLRISSVCHRWKRVAGDWLLWKHVDLSTYVMGSRIMWHLLNRSMVTHLQTLHLRGSYLFTWDPRGRLTAPLIQAIRRECPQLWRLSLHLANLRYVPLSALPSTLRVLELSDCEMAEEWLVSEPRVPLPPLESLLLLCTRILTEEQLWELGRLPSLSRLLVNSISRLTLRGLDRGLRDLHGLQHFELHCCPLSTDRVLGILAQHLTLLCSLRINIRDLSVVGLKYLSALPALERLTFVGPMKFSCVLMPSELLVVFLAMPKLRTLRMLWLNWADKEEAKEVLCKGLPRCKVVFSN